MLQSIPKQTPGVDEIIVLVIDDGSTDRTVEVAKGHGVTHFVRHARNRGLGRSFHDGVQRALELGADIVVNIDGDNQYPQERIPNLVRPIVEGTSDIVMADRQVHLVEHFSPLKVKLQKFGSKIVNTAAGTDLPDAASGFRAYSRDSLMLLNTLSVGRLPESWIPPAHVLEVRTLGRLYVALMDQRRAWQQRIHAQLFHQGVPPVTGLLTADSRAELRAVELSPAGRQMVDAALVAIDSLSAQIKPLRLQLCAVGCRQPGPRALLAQYGVGPLCAAIIGAELGDCRRFTNSDQAVRFTGLDITVYSSDGKRSPGRLARQGSPELRWALFEAAKCAARTGSPDHDYYHAVRDRLGGKRPALSVARKLVRRCHHTLRELGDQAWIAPEPATPRRAAMRVRTASTLAQRTSVNDYTQVAEARRLIVHLLGRVAAVVTG